MCLITTQQEPLIAEEDIIVYKLLRANLTPKFYRYIDFQYVLGELHETEICEDNAWRHFDRIDALEIKNYLITKTNNANHIYFASIFWKDFGLKCFGKGFHSVIKFDRIKNSASSRTPIFECVIPKGSQYYKGFSDLYVSNQIIINKII